MDTPVLEISLLQNRLKKLNSGNFYVIEELFFRGKHDVLIYLTAFFNIPQNRQIRIALGEELLPVIASIRRKNISIFRNIATYPQYILPNGEIQEGFENDLATAYQFNLDVSENKIKVTDSKRMEWFAFIEEELRKYESILFLKSDDSSTLPDSFLNPNYTFIKTHWEELYDLELFKKGANTRLFDQMPGIGSDIFINLIRYGSMPSEHSGIQFKFALDNPYVAYVLHWLEKKNIFVDTIFTRISKTNLFAFRSGTAINQGALSKHLNYFGKKDELSDFLNRRILKKHSEEPEIYAYDKKMKFKDIEATVLFINYNLTAIFFPAEIPHK